MENQSESDALAEFVESVRGTYTAVIAQLVSAEEGWAAVGDHLTELRKTVRMKK